MPTSRKTLSKTASSPSVFTFENNSNIKQTQNQRKGEKNFKVKNTKERNLGNDHHLQSVMTNSESKQENGKTFGKVKGDKTRDMNSKSTKTKQMRNEDFYSSFKFPTVNSLHSKDKNVSSLNIYSGNSPSSLDDHQKDCDYLMENASFFLSQNVPETSKAFGKCNCKHDSRKASPSNGGCLRNHSKKETSFDNAKSNIKFKSNLSTLSTEETLHKDRSLSSKTVSDTAVTNQMSSHKINGNCSEKLLKSEHQFPDSKTFKYRQPAGYNITDTPKADDKFVHDFTNSSSKSSLTSRPATSASLRFQGIAKPTEERHFMQEECGSKSIQELCTDHLNVVCSQLMESVQNSMNNILQQYCCQSLERIEELHTRLEKNEARLCQLHHGFREKMTEQNEKYLQHCHAILEFLMQNECNKSEHPNNNLTSTNSATYQEKMRQYSSVPKLETYSPQQNSHKNTKICQCFRPEGYCCYALGHKQGHDPDKYHNSVDIRNNQDFMRPTRKTVCNCGNCRTGSKMPGVARFDGGGGTGVASDLSRNQFDEYLSGNGQISLTNSERRKCCCGHNERFIMTSSICDRNSQNFEPMNGKYGCSHSNEHRKYSSHAFSNTKLRSNTYQIQKVAGNTNVTHSEGKYPLDDSCNDLKDDTKDVHINANSGEKMNGGGFRNFGENMTKQSSLFANRKFNSESYISSWGKQTKK